MSRARERARYLPALLSAGGGGSGSVQRMKTFRGWVTVTGWMELTR